MNAEVGIFFPDSHHSFPFLTFYFGVFENEYKLEIVESEVCLDDYFEK